MNHYYVVHTSNTGTFNDYVRGQEEVVGGRKKSPFLSTFRVENVHVEVGGGQKRARLCPRSH